MRSATYSLALLAYASAYTTLAHAQWYNLWACSSGVISSTEVVQGFNTDAGSFCSTYNTKAVDYVCNIIDWSTIFSTGISEPAYTFSCPHGIVVDYFKMSNYAAAGTTPWTVSIVPNNGNYYTGAISPQVCVDGKSMIQGATSVTYSFGCSANSCTGGFLWEIAMYCNVPTYSWVVGDWTTCDGYSATSTRSVTCVASDYSFTYASQCSTLQPDTSKPCPTAPPTPAPAVSTAGDNCVCSCCSTYGCTAAVVGGLSAWTSQQCTDAACSQAFPNKCPTQGQNGATAAYYSSTTTTVNSGNSAYRSSATQSVAASSTAITLVAAAVMLV